MPQNRVSQHQFFCLYQWTLHVSCFSDWSRRLRFALTRLCFREAYSNPTCIFCNFQNCTHNNHISFAIHRRSNFRFSDHATGLSSTTHWFGYIAAARRGYAGCRRLWFLHLDLIWLLCTWSGLIIVDLIWSDSCGLDLVLFLWTWSGMVD